MKPNPRKKLEQLDYALAKMEKMLMGKTDLAQLGTTDKHERVAVAKQLITVGERLERVGHELKRRAAKAAGRKA